MKVKSFQFRETLCRCERQTIDKLVKRIVPATYNFSHCALIPQLPDQYCRCVIIRRIEVQLQCILDIATTRAQFVKWDRMCGQLFIWSICWCPHNWSEQWHWVNHQLVPNCVNTVLHSLYEKYLLQLALRGGEAKIDYTLPPPRTKVWSKTCLLSVSLSRPRKNWASATQLCFVSFMKVVPRNNY